MNAMTNDVIKKNVMRRVRIIRVLRLIFSGATAAGLAIVGALWLIGREVWVAKVFSNGPQDLLGHTEYLGYAFMHTHLLVQALVLTVLAATLYLARATARALSAFFVPFSASA